MFLDICIFVSTGFFAFLVHSLTTLPSMNMTFPSEEWQEEIH